MSASFAGIYESGIVDPGLPVSNPTASFWLSAPHALADHQSPWPAEPVDVVIIGSGISGTSLARVLLTRRPELRVVIVDARSLCSGATGRNGGHILNLAYESWEERKQAYGIHEAIQISAFEHSHLETMTTAIKEAGIDCDLLNVHGVAAYYDHKSFDQAVKTLEDYKLHAPHLAEAYTVYKDRSQIQKAMKLSSRCVGAIGAPAATLWPYKLVTGLLGRMIESGSLNAQPHTTVDAIHDDAGDEFAHVRTSRGGITARHVVHATNGWLGHLLPELRPFISPVRGNVVRYAPKDGSADSPLGLTSMFSFALMYTDKDYDYLIQRERGDVVVGRANMGRRTTGDDSETDLAPLIHLRGFGDELMASPVPGPSSHITHVWSGILGFTQDSMPFAGKLPFSGRSHQWVVGGYNGLGMVKAFRAAEMVGRLILGDGIGHEYPQSMMVTQERMRSLENALRQSQGQLQSKL